MSARKLSIREIVVIFILLLAIFFSGAYVGWHYGFVGFYGFSNTSSKSINDIQRVYRIIDTHYDGTVDRTYMAEQAIRGMLYSLDDQYSYYVPQDEYSKLQGSPDEQTGVGMLLTKKDNGALIVVVFEETPAAEAGLQRGDVITAVDDVPLELHDSIRAIRNKIAGAKDTSVTLTFRRGAEVNTISLIRKRYRIKPITLSFPRTDTALVKIRNFDQGTVEEIQKAVKIIQDKKMANIIIDLRNNLGGQTQAALYLLNQFIDDGILVKEVFAGDREPKIESAMNTAVFKKEKVVIITNSETSSAAEVFTIAMKEYNKGVVAGEKTYGKGTVGNFFELPDGSAVHLTIGRWFSPGGHWVGHNGIHPAVELPVSEMTEQDIMDAALDFFDDYESMLGS